MAKYKAEAYLLHKGKVVTPGEAVDLTPTQAEKLGDKVSKPGKTEETEAPVETEKKYTVKELKEMAKDQDIEGYSDMNKGELLEALGME